MADPRNPVPPPDGGKSAAPAAPSNALWRVLRDVFLLTLGLLIGFIWSERAQALEFRQTHHLMIGLLIILGQMIRYVYLAQTNGPKNSERTNARFIRELGTFLTGLVIGLIWFQFYTAFQADEVHLIVVLLVLIFSIARYLAILRQEADGGGNRNQRTP